MKFSQRIGITPAKKSFQKESIDEELLNSLWNAIHIFVFNELSTYNDHGEAAFSIFTKRVWIHFFKNPIDTIPTNRYGIRKSDTVQEIRTWFYSAEWFEVYDFVDFCLKEEVIDSKKEFKRYLNDVLERENSAYRIIDNKLSPITNALEIEEIEDALSQKDYTGLDEVNTHLQAALDKISDKETPDYRNSIKESISAVESLINKINSSDSDTLGSALNKIDSSVKIHPALKKGFKKIYGYTSDSDGIRHALIEMSNCDFEDAKLMLVSCSAFINYIITKADKAGINLK
jgi:hypothetical protein